MVVERDSGLNFSTGVYKGQYVLAASDQKRIATQMWTQRPYRIDFYQLFAKDKRLKRAFRQHATEPRLG
jgi:hypothetical protein